MEEIWKVTDIDEKYEVSNLGRVCHRLIKGPNGEVRYRMMNTAKTGNYKILRIRNKDDKYIAYPVQVQVLKAFGEYDPNKRIVHKDGNNSNNAIDNLLQVTSKEVAETLKKQNKMHHSKLLIERCDIETREVLETYVYYSDAARFILEHSDYEQNQKNMIRVINNIRYTVTRAKRLPVKYGYYWRSRSRED
ncbi:HNH endonuclease [Companilactobacillus sp. HBUAS59699]|uniref:HNH endonuclease n=1 Tax=Companilactobacillus sp. HBUAS59699 TaxID=3109358 RepID=UPI002FEFFF26